MKKLIGRLVISAVIAAFFLWLLVSQGWIDLRLVVASLQAGSTELWGAMLACVILAVLNYFRYFLVALTAHVVSWSSGAFRIAVAHFVSFGLGLWAPGSSLVIDTLKVAILRGASRHQARSTPEGDAHGLGLLVSITLVDRLLGLSVNCLVGCCASVAFLMLNPHASFSVGGVVALAALSGTMGVMILSLPLLLKLPVIERAIKTLKEPSQENRTLLHEAAQPHLKTRLTAHIRALVGKLDTLRMGILYCWKRPAATIGPIAASFLLSLIAALPLYLSAAALGVKLPLLAVLAISPILVLASLLPLGIGGLGGYQAVAAASMSTFGLDFTSVATANLVQNSLLLFVFTLLGLLFLPSSVPYFREFFRRRQASETA